MVNISIVLEKKPIYTPDSEQRIKSAWRILAEMILSMVEGERDSMETPVDLPLVSDMLPSPLQDTAIIET